MTLTAGAILARGDNWREIFLDALREKGVVSHACTKALVTRQTAYEHRKNEPEFAELWQSALQDFADRFEQHALELAEKGWENSVYYQGAECGKKREYPVPLIIEILRAKKRSEYGREAALELAESFQERARKLREAVDAMGNAGPPAKPPGELPQPD